VVEEKYNIVGRGEIVAGVDKPVLVTQLAKLFKANEKDVSQILVPKLQIIAKNLSWSKALKYQEKLKAVGLIVYLDVVLNAEIFKESIVKVSEQEFQQGTNIKLREPVNKAQNSSAQFSKSFYTLLEFNSDKLNPAMIYPPHSEVLSNEQGTKSFTLQSYNHSINFVFIIIASLFAALLIQKYFTLLLVVSITGPIVTIISILLFFLTIFFLPKIMTPNRIFSLSVDGKEKKESSEKSSLPYVLCRQIPNISLFVSYYDIYSSNDKIIATVTSNKLKSLYECFDMNGDLLFSSSEEHDVDEFTKGATDELRDELFDLYYFKYIKLISKLFKRANAWAKKQPQTQDRKDGFVIRDGSSKKVACFYRDKISAIELPDVYDDIEKHQALTAFLLICVGVD